MSTPFDPGLQPERTLLAWRRTCLALAVASSAVARFTVEAIGVAAVVLGLAGIGLSGWAYLASTARHGQVHRMLTRTGRTPSPAVPMLVLTGAVLVLGLACAVYVLARGPA
ncbi:putative membrane protein [Kibdelosporangium banguiense]|uniref:Membrane protein n=1 Tax=Kibdelosporangium banguiense TaxID=1365924 RepID=A0ABS4TVE3_9PSEU|nr:DUF202 domain-containing protein [Kibdelosporangium banguiense]MBP2327923.1 putative membrane protein [Kibdelosporangium banguiense]